MVFEPTMVEARVSKQKAIQFALEFIVNTRTRKDIKAKMD